MNKAYEESSIQAAINEIKTQLGLPSLMLKAEDMADYISAISSSGGSGKTVTNVTVSTKNANNYYYGDVNHDGAVDGTDVDLVARYITSSSSVSIDTDLADINGDGLVDSSDLILLKQIANGQRAKVRVVITYNDNTTTEHILQVLTGGGLDPSEATATASDILIPATAITEDGLIEGTMSDYSGTALQEGGEISTASNNLRFKIPNAGYYGTNNLIFKAFSAVASAIGLTAPKIVSGNTILGINGTGGGGSGKTVDSIECETTTQNGTFYGDANGDDVIDSSDQQVVGRYIVGSDSIDDLNAVDFNEDGVVDNADLNSLAARLNSMTAGQILAKVVVNYSDGTFDRDYIPIDVPSGLPSGVEAFSAGTYTPASDAGSGQTITISHDLGVIPDLIAFWTEDIDWKQSVGTYVLACVAFPNAVTSVTNNMSRKSIYICGKSTTSNPTVSFVSVNEIYNIPTTTTFDVIGANAAIIKGGTPYKWIAVAFSS